MEKDTLIEIREIKKKDYKKAQMFAIRGMHFDWYMESKIALRLYAKYFWDMELNRAAKAYGAYVNGEFAGALLADMKDEKKKYYSFWRAVYVKFFDWIQNMIAEKGVGTYDKANLEMYRSFCESQTPDGEIIFLAADPDSQIKGVGTALLSAFEKEVQGKLVYLYTDNACTYQFYEHRGFTRTAERQIVLELEKKKVPLTCLFYTKKIGKM